MFPVSSTFLNYFYNYKKIIVFPYIPVFRNFIICINHFSCVFTINFFMTAFGNFYGALQTKMFQQNQKNLNNNNNLNIGASGEARIKAKRQNRSFVHRLFSCFSISKNIGIITSKSVGQDSIEVIHGIRAIGIIWIISGHIFYYGPGAIDNLQMVFTYAQIWYYQPMFAVAMVVDSYFVIRYV